MMNDHGGYIWKDYWKLWLRLDWIHEEMSEISEIPRSTRSRSQSGHEEEKRQEKFEAFIDRQAA